MGGRGRRWTKLPIALALAVVLIGLVGSPTSASNSPTRLSYSVRNLPEDQNQDFLNTVSCTPGGSCIALTYGGDVFELSGSLYVPVAATGYSVTAVSCPTSSFCAAVGASSDAMILGSRGITAYPLNLGYPTSATNWVSVSCPSPRFCMAGGGIIQGPHSGAGVVATWVDNRWSDAKVVDPYLPTDTHTFINSMSCTSPSFCVAADGNNRTLQWNGAKWTFPHLLNERATNDSFEISCTSSTFCLALGQLSKDDFSWNGHVWKRRSPVPFKNSDNLNFVQVSCIATTFCVAVEDGGQASFWNGRQWSPVQTVDPNDSFIALSCSSAWVCEAVGGNNDNNDFVYFHNPRKTPHLPPLCSAFRCKSTAV